MPKRPDFPIAKITEQLEISRSPLRRGLKDGRFPKAKKTTTEAGLFLSRTCSKRGSYPRKTWLNDLVHERAQVEKLKVLLEAERNHAESLRLALRMIEPGKISIPAPRQDPPTKGSGPELSTVPHRASSVRRSFRLIDRLFRRQH